MTPQRTGKGSQYLMTQRYVSWTNPGFVPGPYNILDRETYQLVLGSCVDVLNSLWWLEYYTTRYGCERFEIVTRLGTIRC